MQNANSIILRNGDIIIQVLKSMKKKIPVDSVLIFFKTPQWFRNLGVKGRKETKLGKLSVV